MLYMHSLKFINNINTVLLHMQGELFGTLYRAHVIIVILLLEVAYEGMHAARAIKVP